MAGKRSTDSKADSTRDRLIRATAMEVARHGIKGASMRGVAARAEIRAASIFHYFPEGKEQLVRETLAHIMHTIASRMTPTLAHAGDQAPAELILTCTSLLWDFMQERPEYAGALMREAFAPDDAIPDVVRENAAQVVALATAYIETAQRKGELAPFHPQRFLFRLAAVTMNFHAAPSMRHYILGEDLDATEERDAYLAELRRTLTP